MQIVIPMSGFGERFRRAGYTVPKPLIEVDGKPIIEHVVGLFPGASSVLFICNQDHLDEPAYRMRATLERICPKGRIVAIPPHKLGPINAVLQVIDAIDPDAPTIVNYCDFSCLWDFAAFQAHARETGCDGSVIGYTGFHPHMLGSTNYAYVRAEGMWAQDIQEKQPFTDQPMNEFASSGTYYFRTGALMRHYFEETMRRALMVNGEYYVSMAYKPMIGDGRRVSVFPVEHFMQWGTPQDLREYQWFSRAFRQQAAATAAPRHAGTVMVPMAGAGSRFVQRGYALPKPLVPVSGRPMVEQAVRDLPEADRRLFILRRDMPGTGACAEALRGTFPNAAVQVIDELTDGQARTCLLGMDQLDPDQPLTIGACDNGILYDGAAFSALMDDPEVDVIVWGARGYPGALRSPTMYGWIDAADGRVRGVSVKTPLADPSQDPVIVGTFTFKRAGDFQRAAERMIAAGRRINGEFYVDTCINDAVELGLSVRLFEVESYLCWGTPDDLETYAYWQACFDKSADHPYSLDRDPDRADGAAPL
ncbi:NTP transferase domain-containing protein [Azospirillum formosense]|uniref:NTP transferase domain-containing protein n=1 Tax=Azospirillum formosense TaxID=861533 RepID=A0ABX2L7K2_9PROT|nr:NTP transferase domain-containing protein [Azospirillum formosense]MBY3757634.1 NTP transferase domain-containing protein [Azospirillum formosense]NUB22907.1 NTP transferase domain-containing protein [Azospirillum formosense]